MFQNSCENWNLVNFIFSLTTSLGGCIYRIMWAGAPSMNKNNNIWLLDNNWLTFPQWLHTHWLITVGGDIFVTFRGNSQKASVTNSQHHTAENPVAILTPSSAYFGVPNCSLDFVTTVLQMSTSISEHWKMPRVLTPIMTMFYVNLALTTALSIQHGHITKYKQATKVDFWCKIKMCRILITK